MYIVYFNYSAKPGYWILGRPRLKSGTILLALSNRESGTEELDGPDNSTRGSVIMKPCLTY